MGYLEDLKEVVNINSYTHNKIGVDAVGRCFDQWLLPLGYTLEEHTRTLIGNHRHYRAPYREGKRILLLGHLDTVFPIGTFEGYREDEEWVYGPGVCDMKGGNIIALQALRTLHAEGFALHNIDLLLVSDEESGSDDSKHLSRSIAHEYAYCLIYEAAGVHAEVVTGRKGVGTFTIEIEGLAKHAGNHYAEGIDANLEASYKLQALVALTDLAQGTTLNVGKIEGGIGANTISPKASLLFELRYKTTQERDRVLSAVNTIVAHSYVEGTRATLSGGIQRDVMQTSEASLRWIEQIESITAQTLPTEERGGVSDANILSAEGVITLDGLGPFGDGDHTIYERANKQSFVERIDLSTTLLRHFSQHGDFN